MTKQPNIIPIKESGDLYRLEQDYTIDLRNYGGKKNLTIKKGFVYDGATVPRWLQSLSGLSPDGIHRAAALVHDYLYVMKGFQDHPDHKITLTRKEVDEVFRRMLKAVGVADHRVFLAYHAARIAGGFYWND